MCAIFVILAVCAVAAAVLFPEDLADAVEAWINSAYGTVAIYVVMVAYYFALESLTGRTLGKLATGTRVVDELGGKPSILKILSRSLLRVVPLGWISLLDPERRALHDFASKTFVVQIEQSASFPTESRHAL